MTYKEQLQTPQWKAKRGRIILRDNYTCSMCHNTGGNLEVHHVKYIWPLKAWQYPDSYLVTLCEDCHEVEHYFIARYNDPVFTEPETT